MRAAMSPRQREGPARWPAPRNRLPRAMALAVERPEVVDPQLRPAARRVLVGAVAVDRHAVEVHARREPAGAVDGDLHAVLRLVADGHGLDREPLALRLV